MPNNSSRTQGVLYESEAALRLVDNELNAFRGLHALTSLDAAANIFNACDRARCLVDELDALEQPDSPDREKSAHVRTALRNELLQMMSALQFQDVTPSAATTARALRAM